MEKKLPDWKIKILDAIFLLENRSPIIDQRLAGMLANLKSIDPELSLHFPETTKDTQ